MTNFPRLLMTNTNILVLFFYVQFDNENSSIKMVKQKMKKEFFLHKVESFSIYIRADLRFHYDFGHLYEDRFGHFLKPSFYPTIIHASVLYLILHTSASCWFDYNSPARITLVAGMMCRCNVYVMHIQTFNVNAS